MNFKQITVALTIFSQLNAILGSAAIAASPGGVAAFHAPVEASPLVRTRTNVQVNRTAPRSSSGNDTTKLSKTPSDQEIFRARVLAEPFVPIVSDKNLTDNAALASAISDYLDKPVGVAPFRDFLKKFPDSRWAPSVLLNVGMNEFRNSEFSRSLETLEKAYRMAASTKDPVGMTIANRAFAELVAMNARFGRTATLKSLLAEVNERKFSGGTHEIVASARAGLSKMENNPEAAFLCGSAALGNVFIQLNPKVLLPKSLAEAKSTARGFSIADLLRLSEDAKMSMQIVKRTAGAEIVAPAVVHWKVGHFGAILTATSDYAMILDPTFGSPNTRFGVSLASLDAEASGYMLIPKGPLPKGYSEVGLGEAASIYGSGATSDHDGTRTGDEDQQTCAEPSQGMAVANAHVMVVSLRLRDTPLGYTPPYGPPVAFTLSYNQREGSQPTVIDYGNVGRQWSHSFISYIDEIRSGGPTYVYKPQLAAIGGGTKTFGFQTSGSTDLPTGGFGVNVDTFEQLVKSDVNTYLLITVDGARLTYGLRTGASGARRYHLTKIADVHGNALVLGYDGSTRLTSITDATGQVTLFHYDHLTDPLLLTSIEDPFGRECSIVYDTAGRLEAITDVIGITSAFTYQSTSTFVNTMVTPYGTSSFAFGESGRDRWLALTDTAGATERIEYYDNSFPHVAVGPRPTGMLTTSDFQNHRNTYHWSKRAYAQSNGQLDRENATIYHWNHTLGGETSGRLESLKKPGEAARTFFNYLNQVYPNHDNGYGLVTEVGRVVDGDVTQLTKFAWNDEQSPYGLPSSVTTPAGRTTLYTYSSLIGSRLSRVRQRVNATTPALYEDIYRATYNGSNSKLTSTDTAGQVTTYTYNSKQQIRTISNPKGEVTTFWYHPTGLSVDWGSLSDTDTGYLVMIDGPLSGSDDITRFEYDHFGRIRSRTESDGYRLIFDYDDFDRTTLVTYPDESFHQIVYDRLDAVAFRDRRARWTRVSYDSMRRTTAIRDPLGRVTGYEWCSCGSLSAMTDGVGKRTQWRYDVHNRLVEKRYADGTAVIYQYETNTGRLKSVTDAMGQTKNFTYFIDDRIKDISYTNTVVSTPTVSFAYDVYRPRTTSMTDGTGVTSYIYKAITTTPTLGAGSLLQIDGPLAADTIEYGYDELGRVKSRAINGNANKTEFTYDALGRVTGETNLLGQFDYTYDGATSRVSSVQYPNGQTSVYDYFPGISVGLPGDGDFRLKKIAHFRATSELLSSYEYGYDLEGMIRSMTTTIDAGDPRTSTFRYDLADQLVAATIPSELGASNYSYAYDLSGNRTSQQIDSQFTAGTYNNVNQLKAIRGEGLLRVRGSTNEAAQVTVNGVPAASVGTDFEAHVPISPGGRILEVNAVDANSNAATKNYSMMVEGALPRDLTYDLNGNLTSDGQGATYTWDAENRLVAIAKNGMTTEFGYDGLSRRTVEKVNGSVSKRWIWTDRNQPCEERDSTNVRRKGFYSDGQLIGSNRYYYSTDQLGSIREMTDAVGVVRARYDYDPFGKAVKISGDLESDFGFTGFHRHQHSGLNLTLYRAYHEDTGRWLSRDPLGEADGPNLYAYVSNNPVNSVDYLGLQQAALTGGAPLWAEFGLAPCGLGVKAAVGTAATGTAISVAVEMADDDEHVPTNREKVKDKNDKMKGEDDDPDKGKAPKKGTKERDRLKTDRHKEKKSEGRGGADNPRGK